ncbi:MAG: glycosyltransferase [Candidatus Methylacidiphilales bacterium]|nr:glycosyltransferase [Candidatus Methylacidiphilales bacterium]
MNNKPLRILAFWAASDYEEFFRPAFLGRPEYEVEIVSGDRTSGPSPHVADAPRIRQLKQRVQDRDFDLILSGNIWNTPYPGNKGFWTSLSVALRFTLWKRRMLDTCLAPDIARPGSAKQKSQGETAPIPFAAVDLRDSPFILPADWPLLASCDLFFKRELFFWEAKSLLVMRHMRGGTEVDPLAAKLRPLSYGVRPLFEGKPRRPMAERDVDLFVSGLGNPIRDEVKEKMRRLSTAAGGPYRVEIADFLTEEGYDDMLQRAKLVVCTESFGCETWRQLEVAACGAVPVINWPYAQHHMPLEPDRHAIYFSMIGDDFERQVARALSDLPRLEEMSRDVQAHTLAHKTRAAIGDYIVQTALKEAGQTTEA